MSETESLSRPVFDGLKVVEFGLLIAGPLAGTLLADLGAEVIHVEEPGVGDPTRRLGLDKDGHNLLWVAGSRNKRSVTLDLASPEGQGVARRLAAWADVVIVNYRNKALQRWGLDWDTLHELNPTLVMLQVSGFGTDTTKRDAPGFGRVGEAMSGVVHLTGHAGQPPVHAGFPHGDSVTALMGAFAISAALTMRDRDDFAGEYIDLALFETLYRLIDWQVVVYDQLGLAAERAGNQLAISPGSVVNTYETSDDRYVTVSSGTPRSVQNVAVLLGHPADEFATADQQRGQRDRLDAGLRTWIKSRPLAECLERMAECEVVAAPIFSAADIVADETYRERGDVISVDDPVLGPVRMPSVIPKFRNHGGRVWRTGPALGEDNELVYREFLGIDEHAYRQLEANGTI